MIERDFFDAVAKSDFCQRYYSLCTQLSVRDIPACVISHQTIKRLLLELDRSMQRDSRDYAYSCEQYLPRGTIHEGFAIQNSAMLEFWFWFEDADQRIGSNFAVIAFEASKLSGIPSAQPTYPRPEFHNVDELRHILGECFDLADTLCGVLDQLLGQQIPSKKEDV